jgi:hypothetical protein
MAVSLAGEPGVPASVIVSVSALSGASAVCAKTAKHIIIAIKKINAFVAPDFFLFRASPPCFSLYIFTITPPNYVAKTLIKPVELYYIRHIDKDKIRVCGLSDK